MAREVTANTGQPEVLLEVRNLVKHFPIRQGIIFSKQVGAVQAVDDVSFTVHTGETLGLVGESGCGKTTTGRLILRLIEPTSGDVIFDGKNIPTLPKDELRELRKDMQIIFQDPYGSLNPRMTVGDIIGEPLHIHKLARGPEKEKRVRELLEVVGLSAFHARRFPHEFSGGQRQRIGIARALAVRPKLIICDEPVSALDVSIQAQVINLLQRFKQEQELTYLFIAHDLSMVRYVSDTVGVMYLGKMVEICDSEEIYRNPLHPYTRGLLAAIPVPDPGAAKERTRSVAIRGDLPSPISPPRGCRFHTRCKEVMDICRRVEPPLLTKEGDHKVACHLYGSLQ